MLAASALTALLAVALALWAAGPVGSGPPPTSQPEGPPPATGKLAAATPARLSAQPPTTQPAKPRLALKVLSFNVNWGMPRSEQAAKVIIDSGADIVCLQETHARWERFLAPRVRGAYPYRAFRHAPGNGAAGLAVLSRFPFLLKAVVQPPGAWGPAMLVEARTRIGKVQLLNVHLRPGLDDRGRVTVRQVVETLAIHRKEIAGAFEQARPTGPLIVLGDFNEGEEGGAIRWLLERKMTNALPRFDKTSPTWHWMLPGNVLVEGRLDHVLYSSELDCLSARVINVDVSDHMPVEAVIVARPEPPTTAPDDGGKRP